MGLLKKFFHQEEKEGDFEEISEKPTSTAGYFLLLLMLIFILTIGNTILHDLRSIPDRPTMPASCLRFLAGTDSSIKEHLAKLVDYTNCKFTDIDNKFLLKNKWESLTEDLKVLRANNVELLDVNSQLSSNKSQTSKLEKELGTLASQYDLSLQEIMAGVPLILNNESIVQQIQTKRTQLQSLTATKSALDTKVIVLNKKVTDQVDKITKTSNFVSLKTAYGEATEYYLNKTAFYNFALFLLELIFVLPFFAIALYFYLKLKRKNSPHTIIWTFVLFAAAILFLESVLKFLYHVLPIEWFTRIFKFLASIPALRYIIYYGSVILVILIFGGIVYYMQKKVFNPKKIALRRLKDNKCPHCAFLLNHEHNFCPKCRQQLKTKCNHCGQLRIEYLDYCPFCGESNKEVQKMLS